MTRCIYYLTCRHGYLRRETGGQDYPAASVSTPGTRRAWGEDSQILNGSASEVCGGDVHSTPRGGRTGKVKLGMSFLSSHQS